MDLTALRKKLCELGIPEDAYSLEGGLPNEQYCISIDSGTWVTYYSERGCRTSLTTHNCEADACHYFLERIITALKPYNK